MKLRQNWLTFVLLLVIASLLLVACERPLPGGYNDPGSGSDTGVPQVPDSVPEVDSGAYPVGVEPAAPVEAVPIEAYPAEAVVPVEPVPQAYPADEAGEAAEESEEVTVEEPPLGEEGTQEGEPVQATEEAPAAEDPAAENEENAVVETPGTHTIAAGENLFRIGLLYGVSWLDLAETNNIADPANLTVGQILTIPSADSDVVATDTEDAEAAATEETEAVEAEATEAVEEAAAAETETGAAERPATYVVQAGDNLFRIGTNLGIDWTEIAAANGIIGNQIYPGQELIIPPAADETVDEAETPEASGAPLVSEAGSYIVVVGDSIYSVAFEHNISWTALVEANSIEAPYTLEVGQTLVIPAAE